MESEKRHWERFWIDSFERLYKGWRCSSYVAKYVRETRRFLFTQLWCQFYLHEFVFLSRISRRNSPISLFWLRERELRIAVAFLISLEHHTHVQQCKGKEMWQSFGHKYDHGHGHVDQEVEDGEEGKGEDVHEDQVEPGHVHLRQTTVTCGLWHTSRFFLLKLTLSHMFQIL